MQSQTRRRPVRRIPTNVLQDLLADALSLGHSASAATLEKELRARGAFTGAPAEPPFPITCLTNTDRKRAVAIARLRDAADRRDAAWFSQNLVQIDPTNVVEAWQLTRRFDIEQRADLLCTITYWVATHLNGLTDATTVIARVTAGKTPPEIVEVLERDFDLIFDPGSEVQDA